MRGPQFCDLCTWHRPSPRQWQPGSPEPGTCAAFPDGIPVDVFIGRLDHRMPLSGDNGLRFWPRPGMDRGAVDMVLDRLVMRHGDADRDDAARP